MTITESPAAAPQAPHRQPLHQHGPGSPVPAADHAPRVVSRDVTAFPVPHGREEEWRFTPLKRLRDVHTRTDLGTDLTVEVDAAAGVVVERVPVADPRVAAVWTPTDRVAALGLAGTSQATVITVPSDVVVDGVTTVRLTGDGADRLSHGHVRVIVGRHASAVIVLDHSGSAIYAGSVEVSVDDGGSLTLVSLQDWDRDAVHLGHLNARVGRDARYRSFAVSLGGDVVRLVSSVSYDGPGGDAELLGLYFADAGQHLEHRLFVDHEAPHCRSNVIYKGALQGQDAHAVWIGDVLIRAAAKGTDTYEINRNLVLTDGARADSVPNLEIETGEVAGAGHASATGRFDDQQLFYLQARGIPADQAKRLVVLGFFADLLGRIDVPEIAARVLGAVEASLGESDARFDFATIDGADNGAGNEATA